MSKQSAYFRLPHMVGDHDSKIVKSEISAIPGVISVSANVSSCKLSVDYDSTGTSCEKIKDKIEKSGYEAQLIANQDHTM